MKGSKIVFFVLMLLAAMGGRAGTSFVYLGDTSHQLFYAINNEFYSPDKGTLMFFQKGNIFFRGSNDDRNSIYLLSSSMNFNSENLELLYEKDNRSPTYSFMNNKLYLGHNESAEFRERNELIHVIRAKKWLAFYAAHSDSLLAFYKADSLPSSAAIIVAYTLARKLNLESKLTSKQYSIPFDDPQFSTIKPLLGNTTENEWMWDGKILRPRWNVDQRLVWSFDGQTAKPKYGENVYEQYSWDGENFKPVWKTDNSKEWSFDGHEIKPVWGNDPSNQYSIENNVVKPTTGTYPQKEWKIEGTIPVPVLILILSGIARPY